MTIKLPAFLPPAAEAYLVGGCVRDLLIGRAPADYDVVVCGDPLAYADLVAAAAGGRVVEIGKPGLRVRRVVFAGGFCDVTRAPEGGITADLLRRDFTVNAMAVATDSGAILDITGGSDDLVRKTIRKVSDAVFSSDPLRLLRAFRLAAALGFRIEPQTMAAIGRESGAISRSAGERVRDELLKLFSSPGSQDALRGMVATGLLETVVPELSRAGRRRLEHALNVHRRLEEWFVRWEDFEPDVAARLAEVITAHRQALVKLAAILGPLEDEARGTHSIATALRRLRFSNRDAERLEFMVRLRHLPLEAFSSTAPARQAAVRLFRTAGDHLPELLLHAVADCEAGAAEPDARSRRFNAWARGLLRDYFFDHVPRMRAPRPINGRDLIEEFGLTPSPLFAQIIELIEEERLSRDGVDRAQALHIVKKFLARQRH